MAQTRDVEELFANTWALAGMLPGSRHLEVRAALKSLRSMALQRGVAGAGDEWEWDLALANKLDAMYRAVADEATKTRKEFTSAVADTTAKVGWGVWPLALAAVAVLWAVGEAKR